MVAPGLEVELEKLSQSSRRKQDEIKRLVAVLYSAEAPTPSVSEHLQATEEALARLDGRLAVLKRSLASLRTQTIDAEHLRQTLERFEPLWEVLHLHEQVTLIRQLIAAAVYSPATGDIALTMTAGHLR